MTAFSYFWFKMTFAWGKRNGIALHIKSGQGAPYVNFTLAHVQHLHAAYSKHRARTPHIPNLAGVPPLESISGGRGCPASPPRDHGGGSNRSSHDWSEHPRDVRYLLPRSGGSPGL